MQKVKEEPVMVGTIAALIVGYAARHGLELPPGMVEAAIGLVTLVVMALVRRKVAPMAKLERERQAPPAG